MYVPPTTASGGHGVMAASERVVDTVCSSACTRGAMFDPSECDADCPRLSVSRRQLATHMIMAIITRGPTHFRKTAPCLCIHRAFESVVSTGGFPTLSWRRAMTVPLPNRLVQPPNRHDVIRDARRMTAHRRIPARIRHRPSRGYRTHARLKNAPGSHFGVVLDRPYVV